VAGVIGPLAEQHPLTAVAAAPLPPAVCDRQLMREVLENLIGNAYKFSARVAAPRVEIGHIEEAAESVYFVRDNGVGFDMRYADKLFNTFQRLHGVDEYPGLGAGLVVTKRVVERHGGRIWAQAKPDEGATLYFSLGAATRGA